MRLLPLLLVLGTPFALAQAPNHDTHRALIQRDQQSAEFAARLRGHEAVIELESLHERQNRELAHPVRPDLQPYQRYRFFEERESVSDTGRAPVSDTDLSPLPLPGGMPSGVDPVMPQGLPY